jgi:hypothetical protein
MQVLRQVVDNEKNCDSTFDWICVEKIRVIRNGNNRITGSPDNVSSSNDYHLIMKTGGSTYDHPSFVIPLHFLIQTGAQDLQNLSE